MLRLLFLPSAFFGVLSCFPLPAASFTAPVPDLSRGIPPVPDTLSLGSQFTRIAQHLNPAEREKTILRLILEGDVPQFLRKLVPVKLQRRARNGGELTATVFVTPDYLAIGSDDDYIRTPMNLHTAAAIAIRTGFVLPTRRIVDEIYRQAAFHFAPEPMQAGPRMRSTEYYRDHNTEIDLQARSLGIRAGALVSGDKKDVVLTKLLASNPGRIAIYGWHRLNGIAIQPLSTVHGACYADYSHGIRLVSDRVLVNGQTRSFYDVAEDPVLSVLVSDEGPISGARSLMERAAQLTDCVPH